MQEDGIFLSRSCILVRVTFLLMTATALGVTNAGSATCNSIAPVSNWPADGSALDIAGSNSGALVNGATFTAGRIGQAFSLDGQGAYVDVPNSPSLNPAGGFSIVAWIYPRLDAFMEIMGKWGDTGDQVDQRSWSFAYGSGGTLEFPISDAAHQGDVSFHQFFSPAGVAPLNTWSHVAVTYEQPTG